jgi:hypothetical protein
VARYSDEGLFPLSREKLWEFLNLHANTDIIPRIHPDIHTQRVVSSSGGEVVLAREIEFRGKVRPNTWKVTSNPPDTQRWDILEAPEGPMKAGSWLANRYSDAPGGTMIVSEGDITVLGVPGFLQKRIARTVMNRIDGQDRTYLRDHP